MRKFTTEISLPNKHYLAIGQVMAHWSVMEWSVGRAIAEVLDIPSKEGRAITAEMRGLEMLNVLRLLAIMRLLDSDRLEKLLKLIEELEGLVSDRNLIAHGNWARDENDQLHLIKYKGGKHKIGRISGEDIPMGETELNALAAKIKKPCHALVDWVDDLIAVRKASP
ncbi:MAG: hypothetical protein ACE1Y3_05410 [Rhodospirillales bacterium]